MNLKLLGLMRRANALSIGQDNVIPCIKNGKAKLILISSDASERTLKNAESAAANKKCELIKIQSTSSELGHAIGIENCSVLAITDKGFSDAFMKSLNT